MSATIDLESKSPPRFFLIPDSRMRVRGIIDSGVARAWLPNINATEPNHVLDVHHILQR